MQWGSPKHRLSADDAEGWPSRAAASRFLIHATPPPAFEINQCAKSRLPAAVVIEPVSVHNLRKTGVSAYKPETFGVFRFKSGERRVWRRNRMRREAGFPAHSRVLGKPGQTPEWLAGDASADRTGLRAKSLLTGNFTGKIVISAAQRRDVQAESAALQRLQR